MRRGALTKNPQLHAITVPGDVIVALDISSVPPAALDAFHLSGQAQGPAASRPAFLLLQELRSRQKPQRTAKGRPGRRRRSIHCSESCVRLSDTRCSFRTMPGKNLQSTHGCGTEARAQMLDELVGLSFATTLLTGLPQRTGSREVRDEGPGAKLAGAHRLRQFERAQPLAQQLSQSRDIRQGSSQAQHTARGRGVTVPQQTLELQNAALTQPQEIP